MPARGVSRSARGIHHGAAPDVAACQPFVRQGRLLQRVLFNLHGDPSLAGEREHVDKVGLGAPVGGADDRSERHQVYGHGQPPLPHPHDADLPAGAETACSHAQGGVTGDEVEDHVSAYPFGEVPHLVGDRVRGGQGRVRPAAERQFPLVGGHVYRDDLRAAEGTQDLDREVSEPADTDEEGGAVGRQPGQRGPDRVVGGEPRVGERGSADRVETAQGDQVAGMGDKKVVGKCAVRAQPGRQDACRPGVWTVVFCPAPAGAASAAAVRTVHRDRVAFGQAGDARADVDDHADRFMSQGDRQLVGQGFGRSAHDRQVGVAQAGGGDFEDDLSGAGRGGGDVAQVETCAVVADRSHGFSYTSAARA